MARAGGLTEFAFSEGSVFTRLELKKREQEQLDGLSQKLQHDLAVLAMQAVAASQVALHRCGHLRWQRLYERHALFNEVVRQVIRHRFLDPEASPAVIAQKLSQAGWIISIRSVERVIEQFGLQKKTPSLRS